MVHIRRYDPEQNIVWLQRLWHRALDPMWDLAEQELAQRLQTAEPCLVAEEGGLPVAICAAETSVTRSASLLSMLTVPSCQRRGIGAMLLRGLEATLRDQGVLNLSLGSGESQNYLWPGVPVTSKTTSWPFFQKRSWREQDRCADLLLELDGYRIPSWVIDRLECSAIRLHVATPGMKAEIGAFERLHFPKWAAFFEDACSRNRRADILVARSSGGEVIGTLLLSAEPLVAWQRFLGVRCGSLALLGVASSRQKAGIGLALAARAAEILKERGCSTCYINWTGIVDWYAKLGATVWSEYVQASKPLDVAFRNSVSTFAFPWENLNRAEFQGSKDWHPSGATNESTTISRSAS